MPSSPARRTFPMLLLLTLGLLLGACGPMTPYPTATATASPPTSTPRPTTPSPPATTTPAAPPSPPAFTTDLDAIDRQVAILLGIAAPPKVARVVLSPSALAAKASLLAPTPPSPDLTLWTALDLLPPDDLPDPLFPPPPEQRLAFFAPTEDTIFLTTESGSRAALNQAYVHAYARALLFHVHALPPCGQDIDRCTAYWAMAEGYATYAEYLWFSAFGQAMSPPSTPTVSPTPAITPPAIAQWQLFPTLWGTQFLFGLEQQGGQGLFSEAFTHPPATTAEVMFPTRYPSSPPEEVALPSSQALKGALGTGWEEQGRGDFGAWPLYLMLTASLQADARLPADEAAAAVRGWAGGGWASFRSTAGQAAMLADLRWVTGEDTVAFTKAFVRYARGVYGPLHDRAYRVLIWQNDGQATVLYYNVGTHRTVWATAPTRTQAEALLDASGVPQAKR